MSETHPRSSLEDTCQVCQKSSTELGELIPLEMVRSGIVDRIQGEHPDARSDGFICKEDLNRYRMRYVEELLSSEQGELTALDRDVVESLAQHEVLTSDLNEEFVSKLSLGEALADRIATFGGSWKFIIVFGSVLGTWIVINALVLRAKPFDPYPFILLNLILSCLAAIQAPVIMMSQNRQEAKDRLRSEHDYRINLKAELEIRHLHEKLDHLLSHQWERLAEIQEIQIDLLSEVTDLKRKQE